MAGFNTHGGYFAPAGYMKVNAGGSHEENPNGGVQIGVDPQGVPNMLEEGEPVYEDFVFSDNIIADEKFLAEANLPKRFAGMLYSKICDALFEEAEQRPNDPISKNGLDAMLGRLAQAQEAQKEAEEEKALLEELKNMSPEDIAAIRELAQGMAAEQQPAMEPAPEMIPEMMPQEAVIPEEQVQPDMMPVGYACGGPINKYEPGGPLSAREMQQKIDDEQALINLVRGTQNYLDYPYRYDMYGNERDINIGVPPAVGIGSGVGFLKLRGAIARKGLSKPHWFKGAVEKTGKLSKAAKNAYKESVEAAKEASDKISRARTVRSDASEAYRTAQRAAGLAKRSGDAAKVAKETENAAEALRQFEQATALLRGRQAQARAANVGTTANAFLRANTGALNAVTSGLGKTGNFVVNHPVWSGLIGSGIGAGIITANQLMHGPTIQEENAKGQYSNLGENEEVVGWEPTYKACGGRINRYDWGDFINRLNAYSVSRNPGGVAGTYRIDNNFPLNGFNDIRALEGDAGYQAFTDYILNNPTNENVLNYLRALDSGTAKNVAKLFNYDANGNPTTLRDGWSDLYTRRRTDGLGGIYHFYDPNFEYESSIDPAIVYGDRTPASQIPFDASSVIWSNGLIPGLVNAPGVKVGGYTLPYDLVQRANSIAAGLNTTTPAANTPAPASSVSGQSSDVDLAERYAPAGTMRRLPTWPRYAGAIGSAALALNTLLQEPDHYDYTPIRPALPTGRILLQDERYMPMDQNMLTNQIQANNAANARAILNSGAGPATGALLAAADYTGGQNLGNALSNVWQANNQERNRVISANNQNAATRAQFYRDLDSQRAQILNNMAMYNNQNALRVAMLNNQAEQDKYTAFSQNLGNSLQALSGIGKENFAINQLNSNNALGYFAGPDGWNWYKGPNYVNPYWGVDNPYGFIRKYGRNKDGE